MNIERYDLPLGSPDSFDVEFNGSYFIIADKYSNLSDSLSAFNLDAFDKYIPIGYKTIVICKRLSLIDHGTNLAQWDVDQIKNEPAYNGKFYLSSNILHSQYMPAWNRTLKALTVFKPNAPDGSLKSACWDHFESCKDFGKKISEQEKCKVIVSQILDTVNWH